MSIADLLWLEKLRQRSSDFLDGIEASTDILIFLIDQWTIFFWLYTC